MTILDIYEKATEAYNREPNDEVARVWQAVLGRWTADEVLGALRTHQADGTIEEYSHKPKGAFMPMPAELIAILHEKARATVRGSQLTCGQCENGWIIDGSLPPGKRSAKRCGKCAELRKLAVENRGVHKNQTTGAEKWEHAQHR